MIQNGELYQKSVNWNCLTEIDSAAPKNIKDMCR